MRLRLAAGLVAALGMAGILVACGGGNVREIDLAPTRDALPLYPGAAVAKEGIRPIAGAVQGADSLFSYDRIYGVPSGATWDGVRDKMVTLLTQAGWQQEGEVTSNSKGMRDYCSQDWVKCASFVKDGIRVVISVPLPIQFNPAAAQGVTYHAHLEPQ